MGTVSRNIVTGSLIENGYWTIPSEEHNNKIRLYLNRNLGDICSFTTINTSSYTNPTNPVFSIQGEIKFEIKESGNLTTLTTLCLYPM